MWQSAAQQPSPGGDRQLEREVAPLVDRSQPLMEEHEPGPVQIGLHQDATHCEADARHGHAEVVDHLVSIEYPVAGIQ